MEEPAGTHYQYVPSAENNGVFGREQSFGQGPSASGLEPLP